MPKAHKGCDGPIKRVYETADNGTQEIFEICLSEPTDLYVWTSKYATFEIDLCLMCYKMYIRKGKDIVAKANST